MNTIITEDKIEVKPGYKKTAVGIIPEDWEMQKMKEMGKFYRGKGIPKKDLVDEGLNAIRYGEIYTVHHYFIKEFYSFIAKETANTSFLLNKGDILFTGSGETLEDIGKSVAFISDEKAYAGGDITILRPKKNEYYSKFLGFLTNNDVFRKQTYRAGQGQSVVHIYPSNLKKIHLPIPPLPEQKAIADCLSTWDKGIEKLSALIASKKEQKKGLMQQLLTGKKRLDGFTEEWNPKRLNVIGKVNYGTRIVKGNVEEGEYFVYGGGGKTFTNKEYNREDRMIIARFAMSKECARFVKGKFYLNDSGLTVDANEKTNQSFLDYLLFFNQHNIYKLRAGGAQQNLDVQAFRGISLSIPSIEEQTAIAEVLTAADKEIELLEKKLEAFKIQKKGLMQVLLTGERRLVES